MATTPSFDVLLGAFMSPDNAVRRQAEVMWEDMKQRAPDEVYGSYDCGIQYFELNCSPHGLAQRDENTPTTV